MTAKEYLQNKYPSMKEHWNEHNVIDDNWVAQMMDEYAKQESVGFAEWAFGDDINPFIFVKGKWMQANGNSTSWTTEQLYHLYQQTK